MHGSKSGWSMPAHNGYSCRHTRLRDLDEGQGVSHDVIKELRQATDMSFWPSEEMDSMTALVATERHLWLNLYEIKEKDKSFLVDALLSPPALFGDEFSSVVERFHENGFTTVSGIPELFLECPLNKLGGRDSTLSRRPLRRREI